MTALVVLVAFVLFDWTVVVKPQRGKPFRDLLVEGYHLTNGRESIPADTQMPTWMRDQSKEWQARTQELIGERLKPADAQTWQKAIVIGTVDDETVNGYQCVWPSNKVAALETIIARDFDSKVMHSDDVGSIYWLNAVNGKVDISEALKGGKIQGRLYLNGGGRAKNPSGQIIVTGHDPALKDGTITFTPSAP
jgi:hypothetical protein